jgi:mono/diheme cytochrome c family protein
MDGVLKPTATLLAGLALLAAARGEEPTAAERGKDHLLGQAYVPPTIPMAAFDNVWKQWGVKEKPTPDELSRMLRERYGLHEAPYPNNGLPMGLRQADLPLGAGKGISQDCLLCHGGAIAGKSYVGLGNSTIDFQAFSEDVSRAEGRSGRTPFAFCNVRGTIEAGGFAVFLLSYREPDLTLRTKRLDLDLHDDLCEDTPAWWLLKKKKTMYYDGGGDQRSVRSLMQFMMSPLNLPDAFANAEPDFKDIREFILSIQPPKYPLPIDEKLAEDGRLLFEVNCSRCHGTYGEHWTYPNKVIPIEKIGTDRKRFDGLSRKFGEYYNKTWFAEECKALPSEGYQAPPLDGIWATAPYFHNGSAPTVYDVLNSKGRPKVFTRSYRTDLDAYDPEKLGWKVQVLAEPPDPETTPAIERRKVYDTTKPGRGNGGHTFGDALSDEERRAVIEYLKTL